MYFIREWDTGFRAWVLFDFADDEELAKRKGRVAWRRGAAGIKIDHYPPGPVRLKRTIVESMRKNT